MIMNKAGFGKVKKVQGFSHKNKTSLCANWNEVVKKGIRFFLQMQKHLCSFVQCSVCVASAHISLFPAFQTFFCENIQETFPLRCPLVPVQKSANWIGFAIKPWRICFRDFNPICHKTPEDLFLRIHSDLPGELARVSISGCAGTNTLGDSQGTKL